MMYIFMKLKNWMKNSGSLLTTIMDETSLAANHVQKDT